MNSIYLSGETSTLAYSHSIFGEKFYSGTISVERLSGSVDELPVLVSELLVHKWQDKIAILGSIRTRNVDRHLQLYVFADEILPYQGDINTAQLSGTVCNNPESRQTPLGRKITNITLATHRQYNKSDYIPCIAWGDIPLLIQGDVLEIRGRLQSRTYNENSTTYELSVSEIA